MDKAATEIRNLEVTKQKLQQEIRSLKFGIERFSGDPDLIKFYTGFADYKTFIAVFASLEPSATLMIRWSQIQRNRGTQREILNVEGVFRNEALPLIDQFFLFLCRIKVGLFEQDLAVRFNISLSTVSRILLTWSNYLYFVFGSLPLWPTRDLVVKFMPSCFRSVYPNTRVILDCTEIKVQTPSSKVLHSESYSNYKSHTTFKGLFGITPAGCVSFVSNLYTGSISDQDITKKSGILELLQRGDEVMVDKGFPIQNMLAPLGCTIVIPPFLREKAQFEAAEVDTTHQIARLRIHVERAIRRVKEYHIFDGVIPLSLAGTINQLWTVCCILTNFRGSLY